MQQSAERTKRYLSLVTGNLGGPAQALDLLIERVEATGGVDMEATGLDTDPFDHLRRAVQSIESGSELRQDGLAGVEAIINGEFRPAIDIVNGTFEVLQPMWSHLSSDSATRSRIEAAISSVGRIELPGNGRLPFGGTAFVVGPDLLMTNRHIAELFASGLGDRRVHFLAGAKAGIDFKRENERDVGTVLEVDRVLMIHPYWDMALLKVAHLADTHRPLELSLDDARQLNGRQIVVIGYPAFDPRNPGPEQDRLFNRHYGVKRLQPGELHGGVQTSSFGKTVTAAGHDCSTLGGNSGSALIDIQSGIVIALHFGGAYHDINWAVPSSALGSDGRVADAGVHFAGNPQIDPFCSREWWARADAAEKSAVTAPSKDHGQAPAAATPSASSSIRGSARAADGSVSFQIPIRITISLGDVDSTAGRSIVGIAADDREAMVEPRHDTDYESRRGYSELFLDEEGSAFPVPLPQAKDLHVLATTVAEETLLLYQNFSVAMHAKRRVALFAASNVTREPHLRKPDPTAGYSRTDLSGLKGHDMEKWFVDSRMDPQFQLPDVFFNKDRQAFDKGHIVRRDDVAWGHTYAELLRANGDSYHVTNCSPQAAGFNRSNLGKSNWGALENHVLKSAATERLCVFAGPVLSKSDQIFVGVGDQGTTIRAKIPSSFWKIIVARTDDGLAAFGFLLSQDLSDVQWEFVVPPIFTPYLCRIADLEKITGVKFAPEVDAADQYETYRGDEIAMMGIPRNELH